MADRIPIVIEGSTLREISNGDRLDISGNALQVGGNITPDADSTYDIGTASLKFRDIYLSSGTIHLGGVKLRADGNQLSIQDSTGAASAIAAASLQNNTTDDLTEGSINLFYTVARADSAARSALLAIDAGGDGSFSYDSATGKFTYTGPSASEARAHFQALDLGGDGSFTYDSATGNFTYTGPSAAETRAHINVVDAGGDGSFVYDSALGKLTYTGPSAADARAHFSAVDNGGDGSFGYNSGTGEFSYTGPSAAEVRAHVSATDAGGDGSFSYNSGTGAFTYTGPSASEVRAHFSSGTGVTLSSGQISIGQPVATTDSVTFAGLTVSGDLNVSGTTTSVNSISYTINDPLIHLADSNEISDVVDIGFIGHYYRDGARRHAGLFRNADDQSFNLFNNMVDSAFDSALPPNVINTGATGYTLANLNAGTVTASLVGNVTGNVTGSSGSTTGNAATATALQNPRTIGLSGDVTATGVSFDGTGNITLTTAMANNSVDLTTHTTGNYVQQGATSGNGISGSVNSEGGTFTVTSNATNANTGSTIVFRDGSGNFSAGTITAALSGTATNATNFNVAADNSTNATHYVIFTGGTTGNQRPNSDTGLTYNPSSNTLSTTTFSGALSGNATTATTLATSRNFSLTGDVTATAVGFNGSGNVQLTTALAANTVSSTELVSASTLTIKNTAGTTLKTVIGAGS